MKTCPRPIVFRNFWMENARRDVACNVSLTSEMKCGNQERDRPVALE
jgi:hypothetical protein